MQDGGVVRRTGELTQQSLVDAIADETQRGRTPALIAVGGGDLELTARRILNTDLSGLGGLRETFAAVELDDSLGPLEWELREAA